MGAIDYTVETAKGFDEAVEAVLAKSQEKGFGVLHVHDVKATLAAKGFDRDPLKIIEVCHPRYASLVLQKDVKISLMLPCPISVYAQGAQTFISTLRPRMISGFYPEAGIDVAADEVDRIILSIVDEAK